jgi:hypothetical protein
MTARLGNNSGGLTIVELIVVMTLTLAFSGMILSFALDYWGSSTTLQNDSETFVTRQNLGDILRDRLNVATGLVMQNSIPDPYAEVSDPADVSGSHWLLLHAVPKTVPTPAKGNFTPVIYYTAPSVNHAKEPIMNGSLMFYDEFVLYLDGSTHKLYLRNLINPATISSNALRTTCPQAHANASCAADKMVAEDVMAVSTRYFSRSGNTLNWMSITDPQTGEYIGPDFPSVEVVELTVDLGRKAVIHGAQDTANQTIVRVALRNG